MKSKRSILISLAPATLVAAIPLASSVHAAPFYWNGSTSSAWATGANWDGDAAPADDLVTDTAVFDRTGYPNQPDAGTAAIHGIVIGDGLNATDPLAIAGTALSVGGGGITMLAEAGAAAISAPVSLGSFQRWTNDSANALTAGTISRTAGSGSTLAFTGAGAIAAANADTNGMIGGWAVVATGATTLGWAHNDGSAIVPAATSTLGTSFAGDFGTTNWSNTDGNTTLTAATQVNSFISANDVTISGLLTVNSGGMVLGNNGSKWIINGSGGQITSGTASGELFVYTPNTGATDMRIRVPLVDNGATPLVLVKDGIGRLDLEAANTYTGATILNQGLLYLRTGNALGNSSGIMVNGNSGITVATNVNYAGPITGSGTFNNGAITGNASFSISGDLSGFTGTFAHTTSNGHNNFNLGGGTAASMDASQAKLVTSGSTTQARNVNINGTGTPEFKIGDLSGSGGKVNANNNTILEVGALGLDSTFAGNLSSNGGLRKVGTGTLTLSGANSYTGATTVNAGTLQIGNGFSGSIAAGSAVTVGADGTLALQLPAAATFANGVLVHGTLATTGGNDLTLSGAIEGNGAIVKDDFGTLTLSNSGTFGGTATITAGALKASGFNDTAGVALGAATLSGSGSVGAVAVTDPAAVISNGNGDNDDLQVASLAFSSPATFNLNKSADPATPAVTVTGNLTSTAGITVSLANAPAWVSGQTYNLIGYGSLTGSAAHFVKGTIPGLGGRQSATIGSTGAGNGFITLTIGGDSPYWTGAQSADWTTAAIPGAKNWKLLTGGTATDFQSSDLVLFNDNLTGNPTVNIADGDAQVVGVAFDNSTTDYVIQSAGGFGIIDGTSVATLTKSGSGTVTLLTANSYTGVTTINDGTLRLGDGTTDGDIAASPGIVNNATLELNRSAGTFTYGGAISGFGELVKNGAGTQVFTGGSPSFDGSVTINEGVIEVGDGGGSGSLGTGAITNDASLVFNRFDTVLQGTDFGAISGSGSVTQAGFGTLTLATANSHSGGTLISSGTVVVGANGALGTGTVTLAGGSLAPAGNQTVANAVTAQASTTSGLATNGANLTIAGNLGGSGDLLRSATGAAASVFLSGDNSGFSGTFTIENNGSAATRFVSATAGSANAKWVVDQPVSSRASVDSPGAAIHFGSLTGTGFLTAQGIGTTTIEVGNLGLDETFGGVLNELPGGSFLAVTKVGTGTWTLSGTNAYTGDTTVQAGVLAVGGTAIADSNKLVIAGGKVDPLGGNETVGTLFFGAVQQAAGTWGASGSGATHIDDTRFTGSGTVTVVAGPAGYTAWRDANAPDQTMEQDHDGDGVPNGVEYFMGESGSGFTANPAAVGGTVTWPMGASYSGAYGSGYKVQTSGNLSAWDDVLEGSVTISAGTSVAYTLPTGQGKLFVRLVVTE